MRAISTFGPLLVLSAMLAIPVSMYAAAHQEPPENLVRLTGIAQAVLILYWVLVDARLHHRVPCHDFGFLVAVYMPVSLVWYVLWSRGLRGLLVLGGLIFLLSAPQLCATLVRLLK
jgi:hypothetical protein